MTFILWRNVTGGGEEYVTGWVEKGNATFSGNVQEALLYQTRAAADAAIAHRTAAGWQVRPLEKLPGR